MEPTYRAFGLAFGSELALPGLPTTLDEPAVWIRRGSISAWQGEPTVQYGERFRFRGQECAIHFPVHGFHGFIRDGNLIQFEADAAKDDVSRLHVLGSCTGALLFQRGLVPLHGNTVSAPSGSAMLVGKIGSGKSTTTLALIRRGHRLVADDISAVSFEGTQPSVAAGYPRLKLWKTTLQQFGLDSQKLDRVRFDIEKFNYPVDTDFCDEPKTLRAIYILQPGDSPEVRIHALAGIEKLDALRPHLYKIRFGDAIRNWPPLMGKLCRLADSVRVSIVERPREGTTIEEVAMAIDQDLAAG
jgi:hypothetical protein